jgi:putative membrane protein
MQERVAMLFHLVGFAAFLGAAFAQQEFMKRSARADLAPAIRDEYERLSATISAKIETPALLVQIAIGVFLLVTNTAYLKQPWMHAKLTAVFLLLGLAHAEMANAKKVVKARAERGDAAAAEIADRKAKHAKMGAVGTVLVVAVIVLAVLRPGG